MVYAQTPDTINTIVSPEKIHVQENMSNQDVHYVEVIKDEQDDSINRTISILTTLATLLSVVVGLITLIILSIIGFGFFEYRRWRYIRKKAEQNAEIIEGMRSRAQGDADRLREEVSKLPQPSLTYEPTENIREAFSEINKRLELLELLNISLKPEDYYSRGVDLFYKKKYEGALKAFDNALELKPDSADIWYNKGVVLSELNRHEDALKAYDKALELKPDFADTWYNKGNACAKLNHPEDALKAYDKALELGPDFADAWYNKGCQYIKLNDKQRALSCLKKATNIDSSLKVKAKADEDLKSLWDDTDFKEIVS